MEEQFINLRSKGHLFISTEILMKLVYSLKTTILNIIQTNKMNKHILDLG